MILEYHNEISKIENCPSSGNDERTLRLYRFTAAASEIHEDDLLPLAKLRPKKFSGNCQAWGLSVYSTQLSAITVWKAMSAKQRLRFQGMFQLECDKSLGLKMRTNPVTNHYTFYPCEGSNILSKFTPEIL